MGVDGMCVGDFILEFFSFFKTIETTVFLHLCYDKTKLKLHCGQQSEGAAYPV